MSLLLFNYCCLDLILSLSRVALLGIRQSVPWSSNNHGWALNFHKGCLTRPTGKEGGNIWLRNAIYPTLTALHCLLAVLFVFPPTNINSNTNIVGPTTTNTNTNNNPSNNNNLSYRKDPQKCKDKKCPMCFDTLMMTQVMLGCRASCGPIAKSAKSGAGCSFDDGPAVER